ncbi:MAG: carboxypeptidase regulatory-like domain-containing protein [Bryobacteraceae bacterium]|nr:carboxypeptidase regulatory-like domain-containing protein [Bryobacteraceae bacterium]
MRVFSVLALVFLISVGAYAQQTTGTVTGTVTDRSGAVIAGAEVKLTNPSTGITRAAQSDEGGNFRFLQLPLGVYSLETSSAGFKAFRREGIVVEADRSLAVPVALEVGNVTEVIEVQGGAELLEPNTSALGTVMEQRKVDELPLNGRNPTGLANLVPTVRGIGYFGGQVLSSWRLSAISIGGGQPLSNGFMVDGIASEKMFTSGTQAFPTVDSTQEFKILTNAMSAEFGRTGGGIVSLVTKSGTNEFHGNLFEFVRNSAFNANDFFSNRAGRARPFLAWNQFGGSLGGPLKRNKVFFFTNYEAFRERRVSQSIVTSPTALQRAGDFSDTRTANGNLINIYDPFSTRANPDAQGQFIRDQFPGNRIPASRINRVGQEILKFYPLPNLPGLANTQAQNLFLQAGGPIDRNTFTAKGDWNITSSRRLSGRYTWDDLDWQFPKLFGTPAETDGRTVFIPRHGASVNYTDTLRPTLLLDVKLGFNRENENFFTPSQGFDIATLGFPESFKRVAYVGRGADTGRFPRMSVADLNTFGGLGSRGNPSMTTLASAAVTKIFSKHTVKTGVEQRFYARNDYGRECSVGCYTVNRGFTQGPNPQVANANAGYGTASLLLGTASAANTTLVTDATASLRYYALFLQDDWKVTPKLTLNLGLRWDYEGPITDRYNVLSNFDPNVESPLRVPGMNLRGGLAFPGVGGLDRGVSRRQFTDWGPRFGFAYQLHPKTVLRGGFGIIYIPTTPNGDVAKTGFTNNTLMVTSIDGGLTPRDLLTNPYPNGLDQPTGSSLGALTGVGTGIIGQLRDISRGYTKQWNFTIQHQPWNNWLLEAAWVGNHGIKLLGFSRNLNFLSDDSLALGAASLAQPIANPFRGIITTGPLSGATITRAQSLLPYPHFSGVSGGYSFLNNSIYHALAVKVERRFASGFSLIAAYTASKLISDGQNTGQIRPGGNGVTGVQNWNNLRLERALDAQDVAQRLVMTALYELPFFKDGSRLSRALLGGWQTNAIMTVESGLPLALSAPGVGVGNRPNVVAGQDPKVDNPTLARWFNTSAFTNIAPYTFGTVSRTLPTVRSDGQFNLDFSLFKNFQITERYRVQFRAEAFNITNTPTFEAPGTAINAATFGVVTATAFNPKPREVQLALRLTF